MMEQKQLSFSFDEVIDVPVPISCNNKIDRGDRLLIKTAFLGALPNDCGVYTCAPDDIFEWKHKNEKVTVKILLLENGLWIESISIDSRTSGFRSPMSTSHITFSSRDSVIRYVQESLRKSYKQYNFSESAIKSYLNFINYLTGQ